MQKKVVLWRRENWHGGLASSVVATIQNAVSKIPADFTDGAVFEISPLSDAEIYYWREETEGERLAREAQSSAEERERAELARLKAKYEP